MSGPLARYQDLVQSGVVTSDNHQQRAARILQKLYDTLTRRRAFFKKNSGGVYLYGGVGRGKSMLMDLFYDSIKKDVVARRVHFHEFMLETHDWLHQKRAGGTEDDLLPKYATEIAKKIKLLCFDEFHVTDVADAMILSRLFTALWGKNITIVSTSNWPPERLYEGGLQRVRFLPFIDLLKQKMTVVELDGGIDYRELFPAGATKNYFYPLDARARAHMDTLFLKYTNGVRGRQETIRVKGRDIVIYAANNIARASFADLCEQPHGAEDYLKIAARFHTLFIENIPKMGYDRRNEIKRLMTLIDVLYDKGVRVFMSADAPPEGLNTGGAHGFEFERTVSRLSEMQGAGYTGAKVI